MTWVESQCQKVVHAYKSRAFLSYSMATTLSLNYEQCFHTSNPWQASERYVHIHSLCCLPTLPFLFSFYKLPTCLLVSSLKKVNVRVTLEHKRSAANFQIPVLKWCQQKPAFLNFFFYVRACSDIDVYSHSILLSISKCSDFQIHTLWIQASHISSPLGGSQVCPGSVLWASHQQHQAMTQPHFLLLVLSS